MATVLLFGTDVGDDAAVLEGVAQAVGSAGFRPIFARTFAEASEAIRTQLPLLVLADRERAAGGEPGLGQLALPPGMALIVYRTERSGAVQPLPPSVQRITLADLALPLERHRLLALLQFIAGRARATGRMPMESPPEERLP